MTADQMSRPQGVGDISVVPSVVLGMSTIRARITTATLAVTAVFALSACGAVGLVSQDNAPATPTTTTSSAPSTTRTPAAVPTLPTREPVPATEHIAEPTDPLRGGVESAVADIQDFWRSQIGQSFPVALEQFDSSVGDVPSCGGEPVEDAAVCVRSSGETLYWDREARERELRDGGILAVVWTLAHEMGHVVLEQTGHGPRNEAEDARDERRASCLAGSYIAVRGPDYGVPDQNDFWNVAFPATSWDGESDKDYRIRRDSTNYGMKQVADRLAHCLTTP